MANITRKIGLSLGADDCWPICFEDIVGDMKLDLSQILWFDALLSHMHANTGSN